MRALETGGEGGDGPPNLARRQEAGPDQRTDVANAVPGAGQSRVSPRGDGRRDHPHLGEALYLARSQA